MDIPEARFAPERRALDSAPARLPLVTLYLTERCNSRCATCDYWQHGRADVSVESVVQLLPDLAELKTEVVVLSGGEPLLHPAWDRIAALLKCQGIKVWLLTSGLSLAKHVQRAVVLFDDITVSLDGTERATYTKIRGLDAFDKVCEGIQAASSRGNAPSLRVTLQRSNYRELCAFVELAKRLGARRLSFLAVDVGNSSAFGRAADLPRPVALLAEDLPVFEQCLDRLEREHADDFHSGLIAESPQKLRRTLQYFNALLDQGPYPAVRCNAPEFSAVITSTGHVQPCFFIPGPAGITAAAGLSAALHCPPMKELRQDIRLGARGECVACVCSKWRAGAAA